MSIPIKTTFKKLIKIPITVEVIPNEERIKQLEEDNILLARNISVLTTNVISIYNKLKEVVNVLNRDVNEAQVEGGEKEKKEGMDWDKAKAGDCGVKGCHCMISKVCGECGRILKEELNSIWHCETCDARIIYQDNISKLRVCHCGNCSLGNITCS